VPHASAASLAERQDQIQSVALPLSLPMILGYVLALTHSNYSLLFGIAASAYLVALGILVLLAPGLRKAEIAA